MNPVEPAEQIELRPLLRRASPGVADVFDQLVHVFVLAVDERPLVDAGEKGRLPVLRLVERIAVRAHGDEAGQVAVLGAEAVGHPGAEAGPAQPGGAGVHEHDAAVVRDVVGVHRADDADIVDTPPICGSSSLTSMPLLPQR